MSNPPSDQPDGDEDQDLDADRDDVNEQTAVEPGAAGALEFDYDAWTIEQLLQATLPAGSERFDLRDELGHGGMGSVFMAVDRGLHRPVALKQLDEARATSVSQVANFLREARISARIDHPNLVPVHELGVRDGHRLYFTMKLVEGEDLASRIRSKSLDERSHSELLDQIDALIRICGAVSAAHGQGYVHCDIKPHNIMLGRHGAVYLMDWGLARPRADGGGDDRSLGDEEPDWLRAVEPIAGGTPAFMAPEQAREEVPTVATDIFALGAVLYFILTGQPPFVAETPEETQELARAGRFPRPSSLREDVPWALEAVVLRAMAAEAHNRFPDVESLVVGLTRYVRDGGWVYETLQFPAGSYVVRQGEVADAAYIIVEGSCEVSRDEGGENHLLRIMEAGEVFGETAILAGSPRTASVRALSDLVLCAIQGDTFTREMGRWNPWIARFVQTLARRAGGGEH